MTNIIIKDDMTFTIAKSEGATDFPRKFYPVIVSGNQLKLRTLSNNDALNFDVWSLENFQIDGVTYTDVFDAQNALLPITWNEGVAPPEPPVSSCDNATFTKDCDRPELIDKLDEILTELKTDESFQLFEDTDGNVLFGKLDEDGVIKYYKPDGSVYTGDVKPYSRETKQTITDYCADNVPYSLIQLRDADTKEVIISIWRNDIDLTETDTAPANVTKGVCVVEDLKGKDCETPMFTNVCNHEEISQPIVDKIQELIDSNNQNSIDEQALLTSIDTKLDELVLIKDELVTANATLTDIKTETQTINENLEVVIDKLDLQITELQGIKTEIETSNLKLDEVIVKLTNIDTNVTTIKDDLALIKTDISEIKTSVASIDTKLTDVVDSLTAIETKLDTVVTELQTINTTLQTEFDETQVKLQEIKDAIELKGSDCENAVFTKDCDRQELLDALGEIKDAVTAGNIDYTALLTSIDTKLDTLDSVVTELQTANATLTNIENETTEINTNLETLIEKAQEQIDELVLIKDKIEAGNVSLQELVTLTTNIDTNINDIKTDIGLIKDSVASIDSKLDDVVTSLTNLESLVENSNTILQSLLDELDIELVYTTATIVNNGEDNFYSREKILWDSETSTEISRTIEFSTDGFTWTDGEPDGTISIGWISPEPYVEVDLVLGESVLHCAVKNDGTKSQIFIRQNYTFDNKTEEKTPLPLEYSTDKITWTETAPVDTTFTFGACPVELPAVQCIENASYDLNGARGIIFEASKLNSYDAQVIKGEMKFTEKNDVDFIEEVYSHTNGFSDDYKLLPNELKIVNKNANSRTIIKVLQVCGYLPIIADVIDETMVLLVSATPKTDNTAIDVKFTDVPADGSPGGATGFRVKRYVKGADPSTAITLIDWTEGVANTLITNNGDGTYTYKDATAVIDVDYMYYYEAYNAVSSGKSNELEASLFDTSFQPTFRTTAPNESITLPMSVSAPVTIDWGDGTTTTQSAPFTKVYATAGDYNIKVKITASREVSNFQFNFGNTNAPKLIDIKNWGWAKIQNGYNLIGCSNLVNITALDVPSGLTNMAQFFQGCKKLLNIASLDRWDTINVTTYKDCFNGCRVFNQPIIGIKTNNAIDLSGMFGNAREFNQSVSHFNTSKVTNFSYMFILARNFNQNLSNFDTSKATTMQGMFALCDSFNGLVPFDTANVTNMADMFSGAFVFNQDVNFNTAKVTRMDSMFNNAKVFNKSVSSFNTALVTNFGSMFRQAYKFNQSVANFNTANATNMNSMFESASLFNQSVSNFDTAKVTSMYRMFYDADSFNQSVSIFNTSLVTTFAEMFLSAGTFNQPVPFNTSSALNMAGMFNGASSFNQSLLFNIPLATNLVNIIINSALSTTNVDNCLINFASQTTQSNVSMANNRPRTTASNAAVATLQGRGWTGLV